MNRLVDFLHEMEMMRVRLFLRFQPRTWGQLAVWSKLYSITDLSYVENYFGTYLKYGLIFKNTLFRDRLLRERMNKK